MSVRSYTHHEMDKDIEAISGHYTPQKEVRLPYNGREVLYITGHAVLDSSCCGTADFCYALVPGYIVKWRGAESENGRPVSEVEPVNDLNTRKDIGNIILDSEDVAQVDFWE